MCLTVEQAAAKGLHRPEDYRCELKCGDAERERRRLAANANRVESRAVHGQVVDNARHILGNQAADAIAACSPNATAAIITTLEGANPELASQLRAGIHRALPGVHNMITIDRRSHHKRVHGDGADGTDENAGKNDPYSLARVQKAVLAIDEAVADGLPPAERNAVMDSVAVRANALSAGVLDGKTMDRERIANLTDEQKRFYANTDPADLLHLVSVQQRVDDAYFARHLNDATFVSSKRTPDAQVPLLTDKGVPRTLSDMLKNTERGDKVRLAEGLSVYRNAAGDYLVEDTVNGVTLPASGFMRGSQVIDRLPVIDDIDLLKSSGMGQRLVDQELLDPTSPRGRAHTRALRAAAITNMWNSGTPVNHGENGKASWQNHTFLVNMGVGAPSGTGITRRAGMTVAGHYNARKAVLDDSFAALAKAQGVPRCDAEHTASGAARTVPARNYAGDIPTPLRELAKRHGYNPRSFKKGVRAPEAAAATGLDRSLFETEPGQSAYTAADARNPQVMARAADLANAANVLARRGRHPDLAGDMSFTSKAELEDAFRVQSLAPRAKPIPVVAFDGVPRDWDDSRGDYLDTVFAPGSRVDTKGYTVGAMNGSPAARRTGPGLRKRPFRVKYLTTTAALTPDGSAIIDDGAAFRVHSVDRNGDVPTVYLVSDDYAADVAAGAL